MQAPRTENAESGDIHRTPAVVSGFDERGSKWRAESEGSRVQRFDGQADNSGEPYRELPILPNMDYEKKAKAVGVDLILTLHEGLNTALAGMHERDRRIERLKKAIAILIGTTKGR